MDQILDESCGTKSLLSIHQVYQGHWSCFYQKCSNLCCLGLCTPGTAQRSKAIRTRIFCAKTKIQVYLEVYWIRQHSSFMQGARTNSCRISQALATKQSITRAHHSFQQIGFAQAVIDSFTTSKGLYWCLWRGTSMQVACLHWLIDRYFSWLSPVSLRICNGLLMNHDLTLAIELSAM